MRKEKCMRRGMEEEEKRRRKGEECQQRFEEGPSTGLIRARDKRSG